MDNFIKNILVAPIETKHHVIKYSIMEPHQILNYRDLWISIFDMKEGYYCVCLWSITEDEDRMIQVRDLRDFIELEDTLRNKIKFKHSERFWDAAFKNIKSMLGDGYETNCFVR
jgi:hypothetical protein